MLLQKACSPDVLGNLNALRVGIFKSPLGILTGNQHLWVRIYGSRRMQPDRDLVDGSKGKTFDFIQWAKGSLWQQCRYWVGGTEA